MLKSYRVRWGGGPCNYCVSPSPLGLDFGTLDLGLTKRKKRQGTSTVKVLLSCSDNYCKTDFKLTFLLSKLVLCIFLLKKERKQDNVL